MTLILRLHPKCDSHQTPLKQVVKKAAPPDEKK